MVIVGGRQLGGRERLSDAGVSRTPSKSRHKRRWRRAYRAEAFLVEVKLTRSLMPSSLCSRKQISALGDSPATYHQPQRQSAIVSQPQSATVQFVHKPHPLAAQHSKFTSHPSTSHSSRIRRVHSGEPSSCNRALLVVHRCSLSVCSSPVSPAQSSFHRFTVRSRCASNFFPPHRLLFPGHKALLAAPICRLAPQHVTRLTQIHPRISNPLLHSQSFASKLDMQA
jgi:hypothetical protein